MDEFFDKAISTSWDSVQALAVSILLLFILRQIAREPRTQAGYDVGISWVLIITLGWLILGGVLVGVDLVLTGTLFHG